MPDQETLFPFKGLQQKLLASGVSPYHVNRTISELRDHLDDLREELGSDDDVIARLGNPDEIARQIISRNELKSWTYRYPRIARVYLPCAYVLLLPASPFFAGVANPTLILRWGMSLLMGAGVTAAMFRILQLTISPL